MSARRLSNIEFLRIAAIFMIVMMHGIGYAIHSPNEVNRVGVTAINSVGNMGVTIFMLISGFFGIHFRWSRLFQLWMIALFYSLVAFLADWFSTRLADLGGLFKVITPITSMTWWFLSWYVVIFCLSPFLNKASEALPKRQMQMLLGVLIFFFIVSPTFLFHPMTNDLGGKGAPNMITAYLIGQYIARYDLPAWFKNHCGILFLVAAGIVFAGSFAAGCISLTASNILCKDNNLFIVAGAVALFCWVRTHTFHSSFVNYIASFSFPLYLVNGYVFKYISPFYVGDSSNVSIWGPYVLAVLTVVVVAWIAETLRRLLFDQLNISLSQRIDRLLAPFTF